MKEMLSMTMPYLIGIALGLVVWFYNLLEKRINARQVELQKLEDNLVDLKEKQTKLETQFESFEKNQDRMISDLKEFINTRLDSIEKLFNEKFKNK
jgi:DNA anti-recombination protein RmuC